MSDYILSSDNIGRDVEVRARIFTTEHTTVYGDGTKSTQTTIG